ncbi:MAG: ADP-ribosylglycohydrolase family protein [Chloroflexota bacterium]|nr:ADP-ribosylglycohydrolase family protein [Chloroflexota bacterium]
MDNCTIFPSADQFTGCILGQAVGDALGFPVEGCGPVETSAAVTPFPDHFAPHPCGLFPPGQYTDDTQMMRAILTSLVEQGQVDPTDIAARFVPLWRDGEIVGRGGATTEAVIRLMAGVSWRESGTPAPRAGNGSAMRTAPLGLWLYDDPTALARVTADVSRITHAAPRCLAGAVAISAAVAYAVSHDVIDPGTFIAFVSGLARPYHAGFAALIERLSHWLEMYEPAAMREISHAGLPLGQRSNWPGISPFVVPTVLVCLYAFLRTPTDYCETVRFVIAQGGDVDTTGAIAGAISGAFNSIEAVPGSLARAVTDQGSHGYDELRGLAESLWQLKQSVPPTKPQ